MKSLLQDIYVRIVKNFRTTLTGLLLLCVCIYFHTGKITIDQLPVAVGTVLSIIAIFYKEKEAS